MRTGLTLLLCLFSTALLFSQSGLSGYVLTLPVYQRYADDQLSFFGIPKSQVTELTRVRLRAPLPLGQTTYLQIETEASFEYASDNQHGLRNTNVLSRQIVDLTTETVSATNIMGIALIDRLYLRFDLMGVDVIAGRQRIAWGVGRVWSPTDLFNPINPAVLGKIEKDGADAVLARVTLGDFSDISFVLNGERRLKTVPLLGQSSEYVAHGGMRLRTLTGNVAVSVMGGIFDERGVFGGDVTMDIFDAGVRLEGIVGLERTGLRRSDQFVSIVLGIDNQFTSRLYGMVEYYYNGRGATDRAQYSLVELLNGENTNLGRDIIALQASYLAHPLVTVSLTMFRNMNDESMLMSPQALYLASESVSLSLGGQYFTGGRFSEFWWYPSSVFLRADLFF